MAYERTAAVLVASDRVAAGAAEDRSGATLGKRLTELGWRVVDLRVVPDEVDAIADALRELADEHRVGLILTTGGTGLAPRDVTPDATRQITDREIDGIAEALRASSMLETPHAMLSRATAGVRGRTLIINLPGSERGVESTLGTLEPVLEHAVRLVSGEGDESGHGAADA